MGELIQKIIQIASKEESEGKFGVTVKIKDENGLTYWVNKTKQDGSISKAWETMPSIGENVQISYDSKMKPKPDGGGEYESRTIRSFNVDIGEGHTNFQEQNKEKFQDYTPKMEQPQTNWERIGLIKGLHNMAGRSLGAGKTPQEVIEEVPSYMEIAKVIEQVVDGSFAIQPDVVQKPKVPFGVPQFPVNQVKDDGDLNVEDIPF